jgi:dTDP-4-amino-4,6-dideoxygalactose transaminase
MIRLSKSCIGESEKQAVLEVLDREYLGMGTEVQKFEQALTGFLGRPALCVVNGTSALQLALQACGVGQGDEVLVQSLTYVASFQAISSTGAKPVACDVTPEKILIDLKDAERRVTERTRAIMPVHYSGDVGILEEVYDFANYHCLRVVEDAAHAFGTEYKGKRVGSFGDVVCFSFDGIKNITSGEGGCIASNDEEFLNQIRDCRLLGVEKDTDQRYSGSRSWDFDVTKQGWRYHMSNIMAAVGLAQLNRFPELSSKRKMLAHQYDLLLQGHEKIKTFNRDYENIVPHIYVICIPHLKDRKNLQKKLLNKGIQTGYHYQPNHMLSLFYDTHIDPLPVTDSIYSNLLSLPLHPDISEDDIRYITSTLLQLL